PAPARARASQPPGARARPRRRPAGGRAPPRPPPPPPPAEVLFAGDGARVDPARALAALTERGLRRQLTEGGPRLLGQFVAAGVLDELCLTISPTMTAGDAQRIAGGPPVAVPTRFRVASVLERDGFLFTRYLRS
ncbi:dihydrofolate reductase family protein, partial [Streptomyces sp. NPDC057242]|uniref:dihydrofolate reductase family protein n=1 Tax=Streptomyces sp. NPDC057242 TaxID=3346063 RepID=UPI00362A87D4